MIKYNIVLKEDKNFILASCPTLEIAKKRLEDMIKTDYFLSKYYNWEKLPHYVIIEDNNYNKDNYY